MTRARSELLVPVLHGLLIAALLHTSACGSESTPCGGQICAPGFSCDPVHDLCVLPSQLADCVGLPDGVSCSVMGDPQYVCDHEVCIPSVCGDGVVDANQAEECDDGPNNSDTVPNACREDCQDYGCGDNVIDSGEVCDDGPNNSDNLPGACRTDCTYSDCGNSHLDPAEECDDGPNNSDSLPNACRLNCRLPRCGDGVTDAGEACDDGNASNNDACLNTCVEASCGDAVVQLGVEQCDATDLAYQNCATQGFGSGTLHCNRDCTFDRSQCRDGCGNGIIEAGEVCDGSLLAGQTCTALGYTSGPLACNASCTDYDVSGCYQGCGNNTREGAEECDGTDWLYADCIAAGFGGGTLTCDQTTCRLDRSACNGGCGNDLADPGEECDGADLGTATCADYGLQPGALACRADCTLDISGCAGCGNGVVEPDLGETCDDQNTVDWDGCNACTQTDIRINELRAGDDDHPDIDMATDGAFVVVWQSQGRDGSGWGIFARRFDALARPRGPSFQVNSHTADDQQLPKVAVAGNGSFVVVWQSQNQDTGSTTGVYLQRYDSTGAPAGSETLVNTTVNGNQTVPAVSSAGDGWFAVAWQSDQGSSDDVYVRRFDDQGVAQGDEVRANDETSSDQRRPVVAMADDHSFVVVWQSWGQEPQLGDSWGIFGRGFDAQGAATSSSDFRLDLVYPLVYIDEEEPCIAMTYLGEFVTAWDQHGSSTRDVRARRWSAPGSDLGGDFKIEDITPTDNAPSPDVAVADDFSYVISYDEQGAIWADLHPANTSSTTFQVNLYEGTDSPDQAAVAMAWNGPFVVVWSIPDGANGREIFAQRFDSLGNRVAPGVP